MMTILSLEDILNTCYSEQDGQYSYTLRFSSMEERSLWLLYYENLLRVYCTFNCFTTQSIIVIHYRDELIMKEFKEWNNE
jgi:hypothetical protein